MIDMHMHVYPKDLAKKATTSLKGAFYEKLSGNGTAEDAKRMLQKHHFDLGVVVPVASKPNQQRKVNDFAQEINHGSLRAFGSVHPFAKDWREELKRIREMGLLGVKLHPHYQGYDVDCREAITVYQACAQEDLPFLIHCGFDTVHPGEQNASYDKVVRVMPYIEGSKAILAHMAVNGKYEELDARVLGHKIYLDTAMVHRFTPNQIKDIISRHGTENILFGSDYPWGSIQKTLLNLTLSGITQKQMHAITHDNAAALLNDRKEVTI